VKPIVSLVLGLLLLTAVTGRLPAQKLDKTPPPARSLVIAVAATAPPEIQKAAAAVLAAVGTQPLLKAMAGENPPAALSDSTALAEGKPSARAYCHLIVIGLPTDPLIEAGWQREAKVTDGDFYIFGFGHFGGDIGYIESDRNPFLHSRFIPTAPYETEMVTLTGSTPAGVALATQAFIDKDLVNGVVAAPGWKRSAPNLLQHDPLDPGFAVPDWVPTQLGDWTKIGVTQASEDEYRGVEQDTGTHPQEIWRIKYYKDGAWDGAGAGSAMLNYVNGLHRRAYGNALWIARFSSADEAAAAAPKIAHAAQLRTQGGMYTGSESPYGSNTPGEQKSPLALWQRDDCLLMSTLPSGLAEGNAALKSSPAHL
jgi:hypothetical protein